MEPLTVQMTEEQLRLKQDQQRARAPPPGQSRILSRATREQRKHGGGKQLAQVMTTPTKPTPPPPVSESPQVPNVENHAGTGVVLPIKNQTQEAVTPSLPQQQQQQQPAAKDLLVVKSVGQSAEQQQHQQLQQQTNKVNNQTDAKISKVFENTETEDWQTIIEELNPGRVKTC
jgi:hypothetical protein